MAKEADTWVNTTAEELPEPMRKAHNAVLKAEGERLKAFQAHLEKSKQMPDGKEHVVKVMTRGNTIGICFSDRPPSAGGGRNAVKFK